MMISAQSRSKRLKRPSVAVNLALTLIRWTASSSRVASGHTTHRRWPWVLNGFPVAQHIEHVATQLALHCLHIEMHRRKSLSLSVWFCGMPATGRKRNRWNFHKKSLPPSQKNSANIHILRQWPYVEMKVANGPIIRVSITAKAIVESVLGFHPMTRFQWIPIYISINSREIFQTLPFCGRKHASVSWCIYCLWSLLMFIST